MSVEDLEPESDNTQEYRRDLRMHHYRLQGDISDTLFKDYLKASGKANNRLLKRYSVTEDQTPQPKRLKASSCTFAKGKNNCLATWLTKNL